VKRRNTVVYNDLGPKDFLDSALSDLENAMKSHEEAQESCWPAKPIQQRCECILLLLRDTIEELKATTPDEEGL